MNKKFVLGIYDDEDVLLTAIENMRAAGTKIYEVFSPYPVHGIDDVLGIKRSRLPIVAFLGGLTGMSFALWMQIWMLGFDWPMIIGGKPHIALPSFIPVTFELTVLFAAFSMVITFFIVTNIRPSLRVNVFDKRSTDDKFVMAIEVKEGVTDMSALNNLLRSTGAIEVNEKEVVK
ncbi:DUF3341 domain-containing protein [Pontibacter akesuensis]|uniref:Quinol:cytochrome c oxidoreductase membrane protein n=1 Tax=Pontibacter akesuensis TaxID=388950 RepID=A0A1I7J141_9BACT|nr:DUF3341 domain-containing protein [Pontibacter akesuensis]GHA73149.1 membrane protein [Pontibacter akesuensis]SFU78791.1 quinol:cytochrome c oxidoreductase membrane protein [Pontibacter akesuensis]